MTNDVDSIFSEDDLPFPRPIQDVINWADKAPDPRIFIERHRDGLEVSNPMINFLNTPDTTDVRAVHPWASDLNRACLYNASLRAIDLDNEKLRFGLMMADSIKPIDLRYGDGFTNSVLMEVLQEDHFSSNPSIQSLKQHIAVHSPLHEGSYADCRAMLIHHMATDRTAARRQLHYSDEEATQVIMGAICHFLDDRFSISNRRILGWL